MALSFSVRRWCYMGAALAAVVPMSLLAGCGDSKDVGNEKRINLNHRKKQVKDLTEPEPLLTLGAQVNGSGANALVRRDDDPAGPSGDFVPFTSSEVTHLLEVGTGDELLIIVKSLTPSQFAQLVHVATPGQRTQFMQMAGASGLSDLVGSIKPEDLTEYQQSVTEDEWAASQTVLTDLTPAPSGR